MDEKKQKKGRMSGWKEDRKEEYMEGKKKVERKDGWMEKRREGKKSLEWM